MIRDAKGKINTSGLFWRQFMLTAGMVLFTLALLGITFFSVAYSYTVSTKKEEMTSRAQIIASLSTDFLSTEPYSSTQQTTEALSTLAEVASQMTDVKFLICDTSGIVLLTTDETLAMKIDSVPQEVMERTLQEEKPFMKRSNLGGIYQKKEVIVGVPVTCEGTQIGAVFAITDMTKVVGVWRSFLVIYGFTGGIILILAMMLAYMASSREIRPIRALVNASREYGEGNFNVRMEANPDYSDEINELGASFNQMADSLQETERQRRDFIANASHELKTPMTTIAGYTAGILDGTIPPEKERQYLQIIWDESRRLSRLVRRMLDLSQIQSMEIKEETFDICESVRIAVLSLEKNITERGLSVEIDMPEDRILCRGDKELITQVVYNLIENASKYAFSETTIYLSVKKKEEKALVSIGNEGNTIPAEEIPLIFERFHKSDKSRSVDKDGYGLGLYVVKTIIDMHKENIACTSQEGRTQFMFTLQISK